MNEHDEVYFVLQLYYCIFIFRNNWEKFNSKSNIWWLHYLTDKLVKCKRYSRNTKEDQNMFRQLRLFMKEIPSYSSACELVTCSEFLYS